MSKSIFIYGFHALEAQLDTNPEAIIRLFASKDRADKRINDLLDKFFQQHIKPIKTSKQQLQKLVNTQSHQGIVAEISAPILANQDALIDYIKQIKKPNLILVLDSIQDPRNLGACLRSANAAGVDCVVINKNNSSPLNALVHKASVGALNRLKLFQITNLSRSIKAMQKQNIWIIGLDSHATHSLYDIDLTTPIALVIGSEGVGLRKLSKQCCDQLAFIPMQGNVESLNVSVATSISLFEASRQRLFPL